MCRTIAWETVATATNSRHPYRALGGARDVDLLAVTFDTTPFVIGLFVVAVCLIVMGWAIGHFGTSRRRRRL